MAYSYTLNRRQRELFIFTVDIWRPGNLVTRPDGKTVSSGYSSTPTYSGIPCFLHLKGDAALAALAGRFSVDNIFTTDELWVHLQQDMSDTYWIQLKSIRPRKPGLPAETSNVGDFWQAIGQAMDVIRPRFGLRERVSPIRKGRPPKGILAA